MTRNTVTLAEFCGFLRNKGHILCTHKLHNHRALTSTGLFALSHVSYAEPARNIPLGPQSPLKQHIQLFKSQRPAEARRTKIQVFITSEHIWNTIAPLSIG